MANVGLRRIRQDDFSAGMFRSVARHLIPPNGVYDHVNGLHDDDGSAYRRGGSQYASDGGFGSAGLRWMWDGILAPGARTLVASSSAFGVLAGGFGNLGDQTGFLDIGGSGLSAPTRAVKIGDLLFIGGGAIYGGSRKDANYSTGTVTTTSASAVVTGSGTSWSANVDAGMLFRISGERVYVVKTVDSNTQITLTEPYQGSTGSGKAYTLKRFESMTAPYVSGEILGTIFGRLLVADGSKLKFSAGVSDSGYTQPHSFTDTDVHSFGGELLGVAALRDTQFVFTTAGVSAVLGMAYDVLDPSGVSFQQRVEEVNHDVILWGKEGIATHENSLIVPALDGVYRMGVAQGPVELSRSITPLYAEHVRLGHKPGLAAVYNGHYVLPILNSSNVVVETLVCRVDRMVNTRFGAVWPWSRWSGHAAACSAVVTHVGGASSARAPDLYGASTATGSRVLKLGGCWEPASARKADADGSVAQWALETRDTATGSGEFNHVRRCRVSYELADAASDDPVIGGYYSKGGAVDGSPKWGTAVWGSFAWADSALDEFAQMSGDAPEDTGRTPWQWLLTARTRFIRGRFTCSDPCAELRLRSVEWSVRPSGKDS